MNETDNIQAFLDSLTDDDDTPVVIGFTDGTTAEMPSLRQMTEFALEQSKLADQLLKEMGF